MWRRRLRQECAMKRWLALPLAVMSLALCGAACVEWARGDDFGHMLLRGGNGWSAGVVTGRGRLGVSFGQYPRGLFPIESPPGEWRLVQWSPRWSAPDRG